MPACFDGFSERCHLEDLRFLLHERWTQNLLWGIVAVPHGESGLKLKCLSGNQADPRLPTSLDRKNNKAAKKE
jgi:hypothetical protein